MRTKPPIRSGLAVAFDGQEVPDAAHAAARRGENAAWAVSLARDLATTPPNLLYPEMLAQKAQELAREKGFACTVLDETDLEKEGMGCLMAVGQGSGRPPRLIVLEHAPAGHEQDKPLVLVGKGITFDTGWHQPQARRKHAPDEGRHDRRRNGAGHGGGPCAGRRAPAA